MRGREAVPAALALYAGYHLRGFLGGGLPLPFDAHSHLARVWMVSRALETGQYPGWSNDWYGGCRPLEFYGPAYHVLAAVLGLLVGDVVTATKLILWAGQLLSVLGFYALLTRFTRRPLLAAFGALLLLESDGPARVLGVIGNYPSVLIYLVVPVLLSHIVSSSTPPWSPTRLLAGQALLMGAMALGHFPNSLLVLPSVLAFELAWVLQRLPAGGERRRALAAVAGALAATAGLTAFVTVPALLRLDRLSFALDAAAPRALAPSAEPLLILAGLRGFSWDHVFLPSYDTLWCVVGLAAGLMSLRSRRREWRPLFAGLGVSVASVVFLDDRAAIAVGFFLFPLCVVAVDALVDAAAARRLPGAHDLIPILAIGLVLFRPATASTPRLRYAPADALEVYARLPASATRSRTFDVTTSSISLDGFYGQSSFSPRLSGRPIPFGAFPQGAPLATNVTMALASRLVAALRPPRPALSADDLDILYLLHVQFLIDRSAHPVLDRLPTEPAAGAMLNPRVLQFRHASPAVFSHRLALLPEPYRDAPRAPRLLSALEERWRSDPLGQRRYPSLQPLFRTGTKRDWELLVPILRAMGIDRPAGRADRLFAERPLAGPDAPGADPAEFAVLSHREDLASAEIVARASAAGYVRLSYSHDPALAVTLDGERSAHVPDALGGAIIVPFPAGTHTVAIHAPAATLDVLLLWGAATVAAGLAGLLLRARTAPGARA